MFSVDNSLCDKIVLFSLHSGFPHSIEIDSDTDYVSWSQVIDCIPPVSSTAKFILSTEWPEDNGVIPPTPVSSNTYNTTISTVRLEQVLNVSEVDFSVTRYLHVFLDEQKRKKDICAWYTAHTDPLTFHCSCQN
jgi:hypothetical protein